MPGRVRAGYGLGSVATGAFGTVPGLMLLPYLTDTLGITALVAGVIVFAPKAWDVVLNPIAGRISDRSADPRGPRRPFLLRFGLALAVCFALLFAAPDLGSRWAGALWVLVAFVACATAIRNAFGGRTGYQVMGVTIGVLLAIGALGAYAGTRHAPIGAVVTRPGTVRDQLRLVAGARDFRLLLGTFVIQAVATGAMLAGVDYLSRWVLGDKDLSTVLSLAMLPDCAALDARRTGSNRIGVYTGVWTAGETLGLAVGPGVYALVLAVGGYVSSTSGHGTQPSSALTAITLGFSLVPGILVLLSLIPLMRYSLTEQELR
nr:MFS transporter [Flexivirga oryzae]